MTTLSQYLDWIEQAETDIQKLNRDPAGPVWMLLPALVAKSRHQQHALDLALHQLANRGGADTDETDVLRLHGRLNELDRRTHNQG